MDTAMQHYPALAEYRRTVAESFARVRANPNPSEAVLQWRQERDTLFKNHSQSPIEDKAAFTGVSYMPYDPAWRIIAPLIFGKRAASREPSPLQVIGM